MLVEIFHDTLYKNMQIIIKQDDISLWITLKNVIINIKGVIVLDQKKIQLGKNSSWKIRKKKKSTMLT